jgi:FMN phosphatase YigB (HAD superfamily)
MCGVLVYSHEEGMSKPDPRFYRLICHRLGVAPHETIFLDDKLPCVHGARAIGTHAVQFVSTIAPSRSSRRSSRTPRDDRAGLRGEGCPEPVGE